MGTAPTAARGSALVALQPRQIGAIPVLYPILEALRVRTITNALVPSQAEIDLGQILVLLVLNRLLAPRPLYSVRAWLAETVLPQVLHITPAQVYDQRLAGRWIGCIRCSANCGRKSPVRPSWSTIWI